MLSIDLLNNVLQILIHQEQIIPFTEDHIGKTIRFSITKPISQSQTLIFTTRGLELSSIDLAIEADASISGPLSSWLEFMLFKKSQYLKLNGSSDLLIVIEKILTNYDFTKNNCWQQIFGENIGVILDNLESSIKLQILNTAKNVTTDLNEFICSGDSNYISIEEFDEFKDKIRDLQILEDRIKAKLEAGYVIKNT